MILQVQYLLFRVSFILYELKAGLGMIPWFLLRFIFSGLCFVKK